LDEMQTTKLIQNLRISRHGGLDARLGFRDMTPSVRPFFWWGHDTLEAQEERRLKGREKDVIQWSKPGKNLEEKKEFTWAPARIKDEASNAVQQSSIFSKWTGTVSIIEFSTKKVRPSLWNYFVNPEDYAEDKMKKAYSMIVLSQEFVKERLLLLGPDLAAAHFLCYNNCRVRFRGHKEWTELTGTGVLDIPAKYVPGWHVEAIDCSSSRLVYEGLQNLRNLHHLKYLDISYCDLIDVWCLDRISGEYADTLEYLNLSGCRMLNWNALEVLWRFKNLKTLVLKDMDHVADLSLVCLLLLDIFPDLKIIGADYLDLKLLENTEHAYLLEEDYIPKLPSGSGDSILPNTTTVAAA